MTIDPADVHAPSSVFTRTITVPRRSDGCLSKLRRDLAAWLDGHPRADDAVTVAGELISNAIRHGSAVDGCVDIRSRQHPGGCLTIDVRDCGRGGGDVPEIVAPPAGFGLQIVKALCASVHMRCQNTGWRVEVELAEKPPDSAATVDVAAELPDALTCCGVPGVAAMPHEVTDEQRPRRRERRRMPSEPGAQ